MYIILTYIIYIISYYYNTRPMAVFFFSHNNSSHGTRVRVTPLDIYLRSAQTFFVVNIYTSNGPRFYIRTRGIIIIRQRRWWIFGRGPAHVGILGGEGARVLKIADSDGSFVRVHSTCSKSRKLSPPLHIVVRVATAASSCYRKTPPPPTLLAGVLVIVGTGKM